MCVLERSLCPGLVRGPGFEIQRRWSFLRIYLKVVELLIIREPHVIELLFIYSFNYLKLVKLNLLSSHKVLYFL